MLLNFEDDVAVPQAASAPTSYNEPVSHLEPERTTYLVKGTEEWTWQELRDYVVHNIFVYSGPFERNAVKEASIFRSFHKRHGEKSGTIAFLVFSTFRGMWYGSPVTVNSFCKASDPTFANQLLSILEDATAVDKAR